MAITNILCEYLLLFVTVNDYFYIKNCVLSIKGLFFLIICAIILIRINFLEARLRKEVVL